MGPTRWRAVGWTVTCVRPARESPIATRRCALWVRDPRATTCVSWRGTRTVRARRSVGLLGKFTVAWPDACRVSSGVPPIGELEISRICQKCQLEERAKNISELTRKQQPADPRARRATHDRADASSRRVHPQRHSPRRPHLTSRRGYTRSTTPYAPDRVPPPTPRGFFGSKQQDVHQE